MPLSPPSPPTNNNLTADRVEQRIATGESVEDLLAEFVASTQAQHFTLMDFFPPLRALIKNGAHIATGENGCAFEVLIRDSSNGQAMVFSKALNDLLEKPDEIPLHMIAGYAPVNLFVPLSMGASEQIKAGLHKRDAQGRTISHWLWSPEGLLVQQANRARAVESGDEDTDGDLAKQWFATLSAAWKTQALLQDMGVGMDIPDHQGITAMDMCLERIQAEDAILLPGQEICHQVNVYMVGREMSTDTPMLDKPSAPVGRRF